MRLLQTEWTCPPLMSHRSSWHGNGEERREKAFCRPGERVLLSVNGTKRGPGEGSSCLGTFSHSGPGENRDRNEKRDSPVPSPTRADEELQDSRFGPKKIGAPGDTPASNPLPGAAYFTKPRSFRISLKTPSLWVTDWVNSLLPSHPGLRRYFFRYLSFHAGESTTCFIIFS
jgi:hypothetical protein